MNLYGYVLARPTFFVDPSGFGTIWIPPKPGPLPPGDPPRPPSPPIDIFPPGIMPDPPGPSPPDPPIGIDPPIGTPHIECWTKYNGATCCASYLNGIQLGTPSCSDDWPDDTIFPEEPTSEFLMWQGLACISIYGKLSSCFAGGDGGIDPGSDGGESTIDFEPPAGHPGCDDGSVFDDGQFPVSGRPQVGPIREPLPSDGSWRIYPYPGDHVWWD
jgi:hypothetical protein